LIISVDHKGLEWVTAVFLSQDPVGIQEITDGVDQHADNQARFGLPSRLIAKTFVFRLIYGGSAYSYANDPEFTSVSTNIGFWQAVIDEFYTKYRGVAEWHKQLEERVGQDGFLVTPSGRIYHFKPYQNYKGEWLLPRTLILNYPVQGLGADIVMLSRISLWNRIERIGLEATSSL
jgi:DNA polymerase I-like protein with 3'-5' exonuclease and polymerase domains